ncbi:type II toxin-antitoxin system MqsR family toxin [Methylobacterium aquaticum]|uniref:type II toxin-antitoxin system MqsR family toxin n=1 Tax=Methylobacterium aquaticum TaxID=270351 RepID=UPI0019328242|nr:type II toxin-antitoxin system MqsR family toxin [Methylobacterium aquaticum]QRE75377.1 type II toxin-antitoxin system MqsR family toxin [Methylobacterium aquaticum]
MSEKRKPTYDLDSFQTWAMSTHFRVTGSAIRTAAEIGFGATDMIETIQSMEKRHFNKSVTSHHNPREWQDVYHVPSEIGTLYVKFRSDAVTEFLLLSFKEKNDG